MAKEGRCSSGPSPRDRRERPVSEAAPRDRRACPASGARGKPVERRTPEALLRDASRLGTGPFFFCPDPRCDVVYFDASGEEVHRRDECYCFGFTRATVREEIARSRIGSGRGSRRAGAPARSRTPRGRAAWAT
jgi:hypothetical protein